MLIMTDCAVIYMQVSGSYSIIAEAGECFAVELIDNDLYARVIMYSQWP